MILVGLAVIASVASGFSTKSVNPVVARKSFVATQRSPTSAQVKTVYRTQTKLDQRISLTGKPPAATIVFTCDNDVETFNCDDEYTPSDKNVDYVQNGHQESTEDDILRLRRAAVATVLLKSKGRAAIVGKDTSVGARRIGSASKPSTSKTAQLMSAVRKVASATVSNANETNNSTGASSPASITKIQSTIDSLLSNQLTAKDGEGDNALVSLGIPRGMGLLGDPVEAATSHRLLQNPMPGTILLLPSSSLMEAGGINFDTITVRVATTADDFDVANLRLSVFSDFSPEVRKQFCSRSIQALSNRRLRGATSLVASIPAGGTKKDGRSDVVLGSVELSVHEFFGCELGKKSAEDSILYITEVAVNPAARRCGIGLKLLQGVDKLATLRNVESLYLHVDVTNSEAIGLYEKAGYSRVNQSIPMYHDFTRSLNLQDGATKGRKHLLLCKHVGKLRLSKDPCMSLLVETAREGIEMGFQVPC